LIALTVSCIFPSALSLSKLLDFLGRIPMHNQ
jgi:hypothetical protein